MDPKAIAVFIISILFVFPIRARYLTVKKRDLIGDAPPNIREGDVECFSEYMELWIHRMRIEGLRLWLSGTLRITVNLVSLDHLNLQLSICGYSLHRDPERNYVFRVMYSGCFVQAEHGNYVIMLNLSKRINRFGGRPSSFVMKCPEVIPPPSSGEHIYCDPNFIEVTRQIPLDSWNKKLQWSLALRGKLVVALEDASLINLSAEIDGSDITVQGRRDVMTLETVMGNSEEFLPLRLVSGYYAYSMEASCPRVSSSASGETVLHIFKRRMGLTKRGAEKETLSLSHVSVSRTASFSVSESADFVRLAVRTADILQTKNCTGPAGGALLQPFFSLFVVLTFNETPRKVNWSIDNVFPCGASPGPSPAVTKTQEESSSGLLSPQASSGPSAVPSTAHPALYLTPTSQTLPMETVAMETLSTSALRSPGWGFRGTAVPTLATEVLPGVVPQITQGDTRPVTSASPMILSSAPPAVTQATASHVTSAGPDLRPPSQPESGRPVSEPHSTTLRIEEGVRPTTNRPGAAEALSPGREAAATSDPPQSSSAGLHGDGLSAGPTEGTSREGGGAFSARSAFSHVDRTENSTAEEQKSKSPSDSESTGVWPLEMHSRAGGEHSHTEEDSHTEEEHSQRAGEHSHTEEEHSQRAGEHSHTEEEHSQRAGEHSHTEEEHSQQAGEHSHTEEEHSHTEEEHSQRAGEHSHTEEEHSQQAGEHSHTEEEHSQQAGEHSHTEEEHSHTEEEHSQRAGEHSHTEEEHSQQAGEHSHTEEEHSQRAGEHSHTEEEHSQQAGEHSHTEEEHSQRAGEHSHTEEEHSQQAGEPRLIKSSASPLASPTPTEPECEVNTAQSPPPLTPPPRPAPSTPGARTAVAAVAGGGGDSEHQTPAITSPLPAASGQRLSPDVAQAIRFLNTWQSAASANSSAWEHSAPGVEGWVSDTDIAPVAA